VGTDDDGSGSGSVLPASNTVSGVVVVGIGLPAFAASRMLRIAGPDHTSAAPTPTAVEPPRTNSRRDSPSVSADCLEGIDVLGGGGPSSRCAQSESSTFVTGSPFPVTVIVTTRALIIPARSDFTLTQWVT
jgi:hypothetical protein